MAKITKAKEKELVAMFAAQALKALIIKHDHESGAVEKIGRRAVAYARSVVFFMNQETSE